MPTVNFNWAAGAPVGIGVDTFSARWVGKIEPQFSEAYTFYVIHDDGARLWSTVSNYSIIGTTSLQRFLIVARSH
ncbi:MAG: hypothetical protein H0X30_00320 [Anaerolineae bacterium]|nr:hypothetical protein [Anaerolineae bacterium]